MHILIRAAVLRHERRRRHLQRVVPLQQKRVRTGANRNRSEGRRGLGKDGYLSSVEPCLRELCRQAMGKDKDPVPELGGRG
jgi:hypothetical protein